MDTTTLLIVTAVVVVVLVVVGFVVLNHRPEVDTTSTAEAPSPTRSGLGAAIRKALGTRLDDRTWESLEEALIAADVGVGAAGDIVSSVRNSKPESVEEARQAVAEALRSELAGKDRGLHLQGKPAVILIVGVNGTGKTTTIAKLTKRLQDEGSNVTLGAADTFRAAAAEQLSTWGERLGVHVVRGQEGGDPASVVFDTLESARAKNADVVIIDTAGRLHGKKNLMAELQKIHRVSGGDEVDEILLVLDATAGQNGLTQVSEFANAVPVTGIVLTKMDGTARGGMVIAIERTLGVPVKFVGVGEGMGDLRSFDPNSFVEALLA
ncbi:MAG TPA: signal recognition particle-docking protein FtsY [Acidimicrobiia bacterium]|nr:signal recognition particle-docking protein FtsY [Acidimicrobiia bacterium]